MSKMKSYFGLAMMAAAMSGFGDGAMGRREYYEPTETEEEKAERIKSATIKRYLNSGLKEFKYKDVSVFALNQKSADRKAKKLGLI